MDVKEIFTKEALDAQVEQCNKDIAKHLKDITDSNAKLEQTRGTLNYLQFLLANYALPSAEVKEAAQAESREADTVRSDVA